MPENVTLDMDAQVIIFFIRYRKGNARLPFTREMIEAYFRNVDMYPFNFETYLTTQDSWSPEVSPTAWIRQVEETGLYRLTEFFLTHYYPQ